MPLFKARNKDLITEGREHTIMTKAALASDGSITVEDNNGVSQNDILIIGEIGSESSELVKVSGAVTIGTSITVSGTPTSYGTGLIFAHPAGTPIYRVDFDQVEFSRATTLTGSKTVLTTINLQPDDYYTRYDDTSNTTGYIFIRFKNSVGSTFSSYSSGVNYTGYDDLSLHLVRDRVRRYLVDKDGKPITFFSDSEIDLAINDAQKDTAQELRFPFLEKTVSWSTVASQRQYLISDIATDMFGKTYTITYKTQPLVVIDVKTLNDLNWNADVTGLPSGFVIWEGFVIPWPTASTAAQTTTLASAITAATDLTITVASTSGFPAKGRIIIDSEVIIYDYTTATTFVCATVAGRGAEGTTATTHLISSTVTNRDFIMTYYAKPTNLTNETDLTVIQDPDLLAIDASTILAFTRMPDDKGLMDRIQARRDRKMNLLKDAFSSKTADNFGRIKRKGESDREAFYWPSIQNPTNLTGS
jgi:hypothetical protein